MKKQPHEFDSMRLLYFLLVCFLGVLLDGIDFPANKIVFIVKDFVCVKFLGLRNVDQVIFDFTVEHVDSVEELI